ncbi:MAG: polysaccharide biosynthesis/export family protein, partial [Calditrichae bacterium]|nr:polysaccharide biosynthesis/export family protein [Calditrichia bacterium]
MKKILLFLLVNCTLLFAQDNIPLLELQNQKYEQSMEKLYQNRSVIRNVSPQVLEAELDPDKYKVGPGDQFKVSVFGELENEFEFSVLPVGDVIIPTVGQYRVSGMSLTEAKQLIERVVKVNYIKAEIAVNITGLRKFRVYYTGEVKAPGTYFAQATDRLSDIIEISQVQEKPGEATSSLNDWADDTSIKITHIDGITNSYDLSKFYRHGDKTQNPNLQGGDIIYVQSIDLKKSYVIIEGNVGSEGIYPLKENETLYQFLTRVSALSKKSNLESLVVERGKTNESINILTEQDRFRNYALQSGDKIIISVIYDRVYVRGEVFTPGAYPYLANYTAKDYIGRAGALDSADDIEEVIVIRQSTGEMLRGAD